MINVFQSFFCHWCQTYYLLVRQLLIWFKYYCLVDRWRRFEEFVQQDVTKVPSGKVELWLCNKVQELPKIVITQCIDDLLKATLREIRKSESRKKSVGVEKKVGWSRVNENTNRSQEIQWKLSNSKCRVTVSAKW